MNKTGYAFMIKKNVCIQFTLLLLIHKYLCFFFFINYQVTEVVLDRARDIEKDLAQGQGKEVDQGNDQDLENGQGHDGLDLGKGQGLGKGHDQERDLSHGQGKRDQGRF